MKQPSWAIRFTHANGLGGFLRRDAMRGTGPIVTFYSKEAAERQAALLRESGESVVVIERSHGRRFEGEAR